MDNKTKINRDEETHYIYIYVCAKELILNPEVMNEKQNHSYAPQAYVRGQNLGIHPWDYLGEISLGYWGLIQIVLTDCF